MSNILVNRKFLNKPMAAATLFAFLASSVLTEPVFAAGNLRQELSPAVAGAMASEMQKKRPRPAKSAGEATELGEKIATLLGQNRTIPISPAGEYHRKMVGNIDLSPLDGAMIEDNKGKHYKLEVYNVSLSSGQRQRFVIRVNTTDENAEKVDWRMWKLPDVRPWAGEQTRGIMDIGWNDDKSVFTITSTDFSPAEGKGLYSATVNKFAELLPVGSVIKIESIAEPQTVRALNPFYKNKGLMSAEFLKTKIGRPWSNAGFVVDDIYSLSRGGELDVSQALIYYYATIRKIKVPATSAVEPAGAAGTANMAGIYLRAQEKPPREGKRQDINLYMAEVQMQALKKLEEAFAAQEGTASAVAGEAVVVIGRKIPDEIINGFVMQGFTLNENFFIVGKISEASRKLAELESQFDIVHKFNYTGSGITFARDEIVAIPIEGPNEIAAKLDEARASARGVGTEV